MHFCKVLQSGKFGISCKIFLQTKALSLKYWAHMNLGLLVDFGLDVIQEGGKKLFFFFFFPVSQQHACLQI